MNQEKYKSLKKSLKKVIQENEKLNIKIAKMKREKQSLVLENKIILEKLYALDSFDLSSEASDINLSSTHLNAMNMVSDLPINNLPNNTSDKKKRQRKKTG